jgi:hypothetical protein
VTERPVLHLSHEAQMRAVEQEIAALLDAQQEAEDEQVLAELLPNLF